MTLKEAKEPWMPVHTMQSMYREAPDKSEQLKKLAELNAVSVGDICRAIGIKFEPKLRVTTSMKRAGWTMAEVKEVYRLRCFGWSCRQISEVIGHKLDAVIALCRAQVDCQVELLTGESGEAESDRAPVCSVTAGREEIELVCRLYESGKSYKEIAYETGRSYHSVHGIVMRHVYGHHKEPTGRKRGRPKKEAAFGGQTP